LEVKLNGKIQYAFRRPRFPIICAVGGELISAWCAVGFQRQIERFEIQSGEVLDAGDATGEGWSFHSDRVTTYFQEEVDEVLRHPAL
jgi:hypothetical protein